MRRLSRSASIDHPRRSDGTAVWRRLLNGAAGYLGIAAGSCSRLCGEASFLFGGGTAAMKSADDTASRKRKPSAGGATTGASEPAAAARVREP